MNLARKMTARAWMMTRNSMSRATPGTRVVTKGSICGQMLNDLAIVQPRQSAAAAESPDRVLDSAASSGTELLRQYVRRSASRLVSSGRQSSKRIQLRAYCGERACSGLACSSLVLGISVHIGGTAMTFGAVARKTLWNSRIGNHRSLLPCVSPELNGIFKSTAFSNSALSKFFQEFLTFFKYFDSFFRSSFNITAFFRGCNTLIWAPQLSFLCMFCLMGSSSYKLFWGFFRNIAFIKITLCINA